MGDFDYLDEADVDAEEVDALSDTEVSPDSMAEDIGEVAEEVGSWRRKAKRLLQHFFNIEDSHQRIMVINRRFAINSNSL